ncbi:MAG: polysaccharide deacetylase family protein [Armatimonadota bacterium]
MRGTDIFLLALLFLGSSWGVPGGPSQSLTGTPSHLRPHLFDHAPPALLEPIGDFSGEVIKGWNAEAERQLLANLTEAGLAERVVKTGVLDAAGLRLGIVKLQAGVWNTGQFSVKQLEKDAARVLAACFSDNVRADHADVWAAVPYEGPDSIQWHWPVFSMSCWRDNYNKVLASGLPLEGSLQQLSMLRYDPLFLTHAPDHVEARGTNIFNMAVPDLSGWRAPALNPLKEGRLSVLRRGSDRSRTVAITIDDGPHPGTTPLMLKILAEQDARVTFFVVGQSILHYPQLFLDMVSAGHEIGNHCFTDRRLPKLPLHVAAAELGETARLIEALSRQRIHLMRPPGGDLDAKTLRLCSQMGFLPVFFSRNTGDWRPRSSSDIVRAALQGVKGGDIILMHQGRTESALALREILAGLRQMGLQPGTVSDLMADAPLMSGPADKVIADLRVVGCVLDE